MNLELFRNLRFEYSCGANVIMFSLVDTSADKSVLKTTNVTKIRLEYSYDGNTHIYEKNLSFHINSVLMFITGLPAQKDIDITPYLILEEGTTEKYKIRITNTIHEKTLPYGNIGYNLISTSIESNDTIVRNKIEELLVYINGLGSYVDESYDATDPIRYTQYAKTINIKYDGSIQTASAVYYKGTTNGVYGLVKTSGGSYSSNDVIFHELRHRYGIYSVPYSHLYRDLTEDKSDLYSYIHEDFTVIHDAIKFETGREDAKVWIFDGHSNIPEGEYTNSGNLNYLAANYIKALIWYTSHDSNAEDESKIRIVVPINLELISGVEDPIETSDDTSDDIPDTPPETSDDTSDDIPEVNSNKFYLSTIIRPYLIDGNTKIYLTSDNYNYNNNFINTALNITLFPYESILNNIYTTNINISPTSLVINDNFYFRLSSRLGFNGGTISLINEFLYPSKVIKEDNRYIEEYDEKQITKFYNKFFIEENKDYYEREDILEDIDFPEIRTTGYIIQIATDINFHEIVYESKINTDNIPDNFIYDFSFSLNGLFTSWNQLNEILVVRAEFIDKKLNNLIRGNPVVITKKWFKYLINDISSNVVIYKNQNNLKRINFMDVNKGFNLIDKIECTVIDRDNVDISFNKESTITTKILYKPIFYKVSDLQNVKIRKGVKQKIGINLGNFLTKVDIFIMNIDEMNIKESSRNDMYVIFEIDENKLNNKSGTYNILNQDFEYISSGNYMTY